MGKGFNRCPLFGYRLSFFFWRKNIALVFAGLFRCYGFFSRRSEAMILYFLKVTMCGVSLSLTALFALNLSGFTPEPIAAWAPIEWLSAILVVSIGLCIDAGKYLFWFYRRLGRFYTVISLGLVVFSWLASLAFFLSGEAGLISKQQARSPEYQSYQQQVAALQDEIRSRQALAEQQLASRYHQQWQASERQLQRIQTAQEALSQLIAQASDVGKDKVLAALPTQRMFVGIASVLDVSPNVVRTLGFAILALFLELCGLALMSLSDAIHRTEVPLDPPEVLDADRQRGDTALERARLLRDIIARDTDPVIRKIKQAGYQLPLDAIKEVLESLKAHGVLEDDIRNSYKYSQDPKAQSESHRSDALLEG